MLQSAYFLAKIGADTAENEQQFAEILPIGRRVAAHSTQGERSGPGRLAGLQRAERERSVKIKLKIKKTCFENKSNTILKIKDLATKIKWFSSKHFPNLRISAA